MAPPIVEWIRARIPSKLPRLKFVIGYTAFGIVSFILCLLWTFPHQALWAKVREEVLKSGYDLTVDSSGAGLSGLTGYGVRIAATSLPTDQPKAALIIDSLSLRPKVLPPGFAFRAKTMGGSISGSVDGFALLKVGAPSPKDKADNAGSATISLDIQGLDLGQGSLKAVSGIDLAGTLEASAKFEVPVNGLPGTPVYGLDVGQATGDMNLNGENLAVNGGSVMIAALGGAMDLPKINFGKLDGLLRVDKGQGLLETFKIKSDELEIQGSGTLRLARRIEFSEPNIDAKIKLEQALSTRLGAVAMGVTILPPDKDSPDFRVARCSGFLNRLRCGPAPNR